MSDSNTPITDSTIHDKAIEIARKLAEQDTDRSGDWEKFKASTGWVENFRLRHGIKRGLWNPREPIISKARRSNRIVESHPGDFAVKDNVTPEDKQEQLTSSVSSESTLSFTTTETAFSDTTQDKISDQDMERQSEGFEILALSATSNGAPIMDMNISGTAYTIAPMLAPPLLHRDTAQASAALSFLLEYWDRRPGTVSHSIRDELHKLKQKLDSELRDDRTPEPSIRTT